ncbi:hypothetical protein TRVL_08937 [Trypanosoma vivax]|nr:hypothetical protein TRVL_08937 [Trypanosoma vivax]
MRSLTLGVGAGEVSLGDVNEENTAGPTSTDALSSHSQSETRVVSGGAAASCRIGFSTGGSAASCRWLRHLRDNSEAYAGLERERVAGWSSGALDQWYKQRHNQYKSSEKKSASVGAAPFLTCFAGTDVAKLCERYCAHAERILVSFASEYFAKVPATFAPQSRTVDRGACDSLGGPQVPNFLDIGCAPGGVSKFLVTKLGWSGTGVSLSVGHGGIALDTSWLESPDLKSRYEFIEGDVTMSDWHGRIKEKRFYFVNCGAVQDHGQRDGEEDDTKNCSSAGQPILPWFNFLIPQLRVAVEHVQDGGVIMFVFGVPQSASFPILLALLRPLVRGSISIMPTMHLTKSPVYVLVTDVVAPVTESAITAWGCIFQRLTDGTKEFWLGEESDGYALAARGFEEHRFHLEAVWKESAAFLCRRRQNAEKQAEKKDGYIALKRPRPEDAVGGTSRGDSCRLP